MAQTDVRARSRRAYEITRLQLGVRAAWPAALITSLSAVVCGSVAIALAIGSVLAVATIALRARGQAFGRAITPGFIAGAAPLMLPLALRSFGHCCIGQACWSVCMLGCIVGGFVAGVSLGIVSAAERENRAMFLLAATLIAGLVGVLGCAISGVSGIAGMAVAMVATSLPVSVVASARS